MTDDAGRPWLAQYPDYWPEEVSYPEITVPELLRRRADEFDDHTAIVFEGRRYTYGDLLDAVERTAAGLASLGVGPGDHVSLCMPNCPAFTFCFYGVQALGAVTVHTSFLYTERELRHQLSNAEATTIVVLDEYADAVAAVVDETPIERVVVASMADYASPAVAEHVSRSNRGLVADRGWTWFEDLDAAGPPPDVDVDIDDRASLLHTGGTTGLPKAVPVTHRYWLSTTAQGELIDLVAYDEDGGIERGEQVMTGLMPMFHLNGNWTANLYAVYNGSAVVLYPEFDPGVVLRDIEAYGVTHMHTVPTMLTAMLDHPRAGETDFGSLRHMAVASAPVPAATKDRIEDLTGATTFELYGQTETAFTTAEPPTDRREGSCGIPVPGVDIDVVDVDTGEPLPAGEVGEFAVEVSFHTMDGYWENPEGTAETVRDGWIHTGDLGYRDGDWYFYHVDRMDDMIITGGHNVYPSEVEDVLYGHDAVREVAVIGLPDDYRGERVTAFVELVEGFHPDDDLREDLDGWCRENLAAYKVPRGYEFRELPRTDVGKISRSELESEVAGGD